MTAAIAGVAPLIGRCDSARVVGYDVHMLAVIDEAIANKAGVGVETITDTVTAALEKKRQAALESYPDMRIQASVSVSDIVGVLA